MMMIFQKYKLQYVLPVLLMVLYIFPARSQKLDSITGLQHQFLPNLPSTTVSVPSLGYAGMFGGPVQNGILAMGGANFPEGKPWEGGKKVWSSSIYLLRDNKWELLDEKLPSPIGYGASIAIDEGVLCIGGNNQKGGSSKVFLVKLNQNDEISIINFPPLPRPLSNLTAVRVENSIYVAGGDNKGQSYGGFYQLNLNAHKKWKVLKSMPGPARSFHSMAVQETSFSKKIFVFGGRSLQKGAGTELLNTYTSYNLKTQKWDSILPITVHGESKTIMAASAQPIGSMGILLFGGDDGKLFSELEALETKISNTDNDVIKQGLIKKKSGILDTHPGFSPEILSFNTITKSWMVYDSIASFPVTSLSFKSGRDFYFVSGEIRPGIRTPKIMRLSMGRHPKSFGALNYGILIAYLLISLFIGLYFSRKQKSTNDYFKGGGRVPWWASGLSVFGTLLSALTFMAIPAKSFLTDWSYFFLNMAAILIVPVIAIYFIPYFNKLKINTAYEFLEVRFNYTARVLGSISFILFQLGRIGIILLLPSLAISIVTGIPVEASILIMGFLCMAYTTFGGIEAVIWTDVLQVIVLMGGSILVIFWILFHSETSLLDAIDMASADHKFNIIDWDFNFTSSTIWVVLLGGLASSLITQGTDQTIVQRYLTSSSVKNARKTLYTNAVLTLPATVIFFGIGTLLFIFYSKMPEKLSPDIQINDSIFPWYIVNELPIGVSGLLIAGVFSAAMSSISSSLNSVSTAFCNDFYQKYYPKTPDLKLLLIARVATLVMGAIGVAFALWMANSNIKSLWDQFYRVLGLITGGLGGMFLLGIITKRANAAGTLWGVLLSAVAVWYISSYTKINFLLYSFIGLALSYLLGYALSLILKPKTN
ncbi:sodium:solute symporter family transporter [Galbibacter pacificus]|uniref:Sodium/solute symporter n=1 Tax=Galbibacter pacificus TaxID=2996052 RepID=A0ABT6FMU9_9FLAO|nr:sodium/solute symporter [Galbibacter pacificus]MDG3581110.1 sodium/solute symporter [Galbibacter pacificus]MDG3584588.1 sodium/solute symporter [Galbibacter pacificus]